MLAQNVVCLISPCILEAVKYSIKTSLDMKPSCKLSKLEEPDMRDTAGEVEMNS